MSRRNVRDWACLALIVPVAFTIVSAGTISLQWDPVANADGYFVYYGTSPGPPYTGKSVLITSTQASIGGLDSCVNWYLSVKAHSAAGESSEFSNEVSGWPRPEISSSDAPAAALQGQQFTMAIAGANIDSGASLEIVSGNPDVLFETPRAQSCSGGCCREIDVTVTVQPTARGIRPAQIGRFPLTITVTNPDRVYQTVQWQPFEVRMNPARFNIDATSDEVTRHRLDYRDVGPMSMVFGSHEGDARYDPDADMDGDGYVDGDDVANAFANGLFGLCWAPAMNTYTLAACPAGIY